MVGGLLIAVAVVGILCIPVGLFMTLRRVAPLTTPPPAPVRTAISVPQHATLTRVQPPAITPRQLELTAGSDGVYR